MPYLILNAKGLNTKKGTEMIYQKLLELGCRDFGRKTIYVVSHPGYEVDDKIIKNCIEIMGVDRDNIYMSADGIPLNMTPDFVYVTEGNTFEVLKYMRDNGIVEYIKELFDGKSDAVYIGSSAGAMIAGTDIMLAADFDSNDVGMRDFTSLGLFDGTIIPHIEPELLTNYLSCIEGHLRNRYKKIYSVGNGEIVVMNTSVS